MPVSSYDTRGRAKKDDRTAPPRLHCARSLLSNDEGAETVGAPCILERRNLNIDCATRTPALHAVDHERRRSHQCDDVCECTFGSTLIGHVYGKGLHLSLGQSMQL